MSQSTSPMLRIFIIPHFDHREKCEGKSPDRQKHMFLAQKVEKPAIAKTGMSGAPVGVLKSPSPACRLLPPFARVSESACAGLKELSQFADQDRQSVV